MVLIIIELFIGAIIFPTIGAIEGEKSICDHVFYKFKILIDQPPIPIFTWAPKFSKTGEIVTFDASNSYDPDGGDIVEFLWDFENDGDIEASGVNVTHIFTEYGIFNVRLLIIDDESASNSTINNVPVSLQPVPVFTWSPRYPDSGESIAFSASLSYDPEPDGGDIIDCKWDWNHDGEYDSFGMKIWKVFPNRGMYNISIKITDDEGHTNTTYQIISIGKPPEPEFTWFPEYPDPGTMITFNASNSVVSDGAIRWYEWDWNGDGIFDEKNYYDPLSTFSYSKNGSYHVTLRVTNIWDVYNTTTKIVQVGINESTNDPPRDLVVTGPSNGKVGIEYSFNISAIDPNDDSIYYYIEWYEGYSNGSWIGPFDSGEIVSKSYSWEDQGDHTITIRTRDEHGLEGDSITFPITMPKSKNMAIFEWYLQKIMGHYHIYKI